MMTESTVLLKIPTALRLPSNHDGSSIFDNCDLLWEQESLMVTHQQSSEDNNHLPALQNNAWLRDCLRRSPVRKVYLDPTMEQSVIKAWADLCWATGKEIYLRVPQLADLPQTQRPGDWRLKRLMDWLMAALLLVVFSPLMGLLAIWVRLDSPGSVLFRQWRVGAEGELFRIYKFRSMQVDAEARHQEVMGNQTGLHKLEHDPRITQAGRWLRKLSLDELPQLWNVLRGEMSLVGPRPWALYDAVRIPNKLQGRLNALPGMTGPWQVSARSNELDLYAVTCRDLAYLQQWHLWRDISVLLVTVPKVLFGSGAC
ncbi:MAG: heterocyst development glycosyltransferase HepC [Cyanobacteria bacterium P01_D01_bin.6]